MQNTNYDLVLVCRISAQQMNFVERHVQQNGFTTAQSADAQQLFLKMNDAFLRQAELAHTTKMIPHTIKQSLIVKAMTRNMDDYLNKVSPHILKYEQGDSHVMTAAQKLRMIHNHFINLKISDINMVDYLKSKHYLQHVRALHADQKINYHTNLGMEEYFGEGVSVYFEFMEFYQNMLKYLAVLGALIYVLEWDSHNNKISGLGGMYCILVMAWTTAFMLCWRRRESELCIKWGIYSDKYTNKDHNHLFRGTKRMKLTTGAIQEKYDSHRRLLHYALSALEALPMLVLAGVLKLLLFNINGLVKQKTSMMYIAQIAALNQPGGMLHSIPHISSVLDVLIVLTILRMNVAYTQQCIRSTLRENHKTTVQFNDSLIAKRFLFELINRFMHLWYIAFVEFDLVTLRSLLAKSFLIDELRKVLTESVIPLFMKKQVHHTDLPEYDDFDDYIEVIFQYATITLFAALLPIAAPLSYLFNVVEDYSDRFKLGAKLYQRPIPTKVNGIGQWRTLILCISVLAVYSNLTFLMLSHHDMFEAASDGHTPDRLIVQLFVCEHAILALQYAVSAFVKPKPKWVRIFLRRKRLL